MLCKIIPLLVLLNICIFVASETTSTATSTARSTITSTTISTTIPSTTSTTTGAHSLQKKCSESQKRKNANHELRRCLDDTLLKYLNPNVTVSTVRSDNITSNNITTLPLICNNISDLKTQLQAYRETYKTECGIILNNTDNFLKTVNKTLNDQKFKGLYESRECLSKINKNLTKCIEKSMGHTNISLTFIGSVSPSFDYGSRSCDNTGTLKNCMIPLLNATCTKAVDYFSSAFEDVQEDCRQVASLNTTIKTPIASKPSIIIYVVASLAVIVGTIITVVFVKKIINNRRKAAGNVSYTHSK